MATDKLGEEEKTFLQGQDHILFSQLSDTTSSHSSSGPVWASNG
ncbi:MAG: hypothetical protein ACLS36_00630 [Streptococcus sp.]